jgi:hypothetical protein
VSRVREELEVLAGLPVGEVSAQAADNPGLDAPVVVGTEAVLHRVRAVGTVVFLDFDQELLAPRYRAGEQALALLARADRAPLDARRARDEVAVQLRAHSEALLAALGARLPTQNHQGYELPAKPAPFVECRAAGDPSPDLPVHVERITCDAKSSVYLSRNVYSGGLTFHHQVVTTHRLDAWRFAHYLQQAKAPSYVYGSARQLAPFACTQHNVELNGFMANTTVCLRAYRKLPGIYDLNMRVVSKNGSHRGFVSTLSLTGVAHEHALAFARAYLGTMRWHP